MDSSLVHEEVTSAKVADDGDGSELRFNRKLWRRFGDIAQPYFLPREDGTKQWLVLLLALVLGVVSAAYWFAFIGLSILALLIPANMMPPQALEFGHMPWPLLATGCLTFAAVIAYRNKENLRLRLRQWQLLGSLLLLLLGVTSVNIYLSYVFRNIQNQLIARDEEGFYSALFGGFAAFCVGVLIISLFGFVRMTLARHWRQFLCEFFLERYLANRAYYNFDSNSDGAGIDNPDQRLTQDVEYFTSETLGLLLDILSSILNLFSFAAILLFTSKRLTGVLVTYAGIGTALAIALGQRLVEINYKQLQLEADMRYSLIHIRDNAEAIAFYAGEALEGAVVRERLNCVMSNQTRLINWSALVLVYQKYFGYLAQFIPYLIIGGLYFAKQVDFGTFSQGAMAFQMVLEAMSLIINRIGDISKFSAGINRLGALYDATEALGQIPSSGRVGQNEEVRDLIDRTCRIHTQITPGVGVSMANVTVKTPTGRNLVENLTLAIERTLVDANKSDDKGFHRLLIVGPSGFGKSSVLRAIAGLWTQGSGELSRPPAADMIFLPQKPYMPLGDLRAQLLYPHFLAGICDEDLVETLVRLKLGDLPGRFPGGLDSVQDWSRVLSGGEQQRLAAARCLITIPAPTLVVLDEATSALPAKDEANIYRLLCDRGLGYISVGHRESLIQYHDMVLEIQGGGAWKLWPPHEYCGLARDSG